MLLFSFSGGTKANELTVYDGTVTNACIPAVIMYFDNFSKSQFVISAYELDKLGDGASITSVKFYTNSPDILYPMEGKEAAPVVVYLKEVNYTSINAFEATNSATTVYTGTLSVVADGSGGSMAITFSTSYTYHGGNLLVGIENTDKATWRGVYFYGMTVNGASISGYSDNSLDDATANQCNFIPKTTFTFSPGTVHAKPDNFAVSDISTQQATLTWSGGSGTYNVEYKKASDTDWTSALSNSSLLTTTLTNLDIETDYQARVQCIYSDNATSLWNTLSFTTAAKYFKPTGLTASNITCHTATLNWTENGSATTWKLAYKAIGETAFNEVAVTIKPFSLEGLEDNTQYIVKVRPDNNEGFIKWSDEISFTTLEQFHVTAPSVTINGLTPNTTYEYQVKSIKTGEEDTDWTPLATFTTLVKNPVPADVTVSEVTPYAAIVSWTGYGDSYNVSIGTESAPNAQINWSTCSAFSCDYTFTNLTPDTKYYVKVQSKKDSEADSEWSPTATFTTLVPHALAGTYVKFFETFINDYGCEEIREITEAVEGQKVTVSLYPENLPDGKYLTGTFLSDDVTFIATDKIDGAFIMPAKAVTVNAELANRTEYVVDLATATAQNVPYDAYLTLMQQEGYYDVDTDVNLAYLDLNLDGKPDVQLIDNEPAYIVKRLAGADDVTANSRFNIRTYPFMNPSPYSTVLVKLDNNYNEQVLPVIESLQDDSDNSASIAEWAGDGKSRNIMLYRRTLYKDNNWNTLCLPFSLTAEQVTAQLNPSELMALDTNNKWSMVNNQWSMDENGTYQTKLDDNGTLYLFFKNATAITAGVPYIIRWTSGNNLVNPIFYDVTIPNTYNVDVVNTINAIPDVLDGTAAKFTGGKFVGTFCNTEYREKDTSVLFLGGGNTLYYPQPDLTDPNNPVYPSLGAFRAYFDLGSNPAREFRLNFGEEADSQGIFDISTYRNADIQNGHDVDMTGNAWYTFDGRRIDSKPTKAGLYIIKVVQRDFVLMDPKS